MGKMRRKGGIIGSMISGTRPEGAKSWWIQWMGVGLWRGVHGRSSHSKWYMVSLMVIVHTLWQEGCVKFNKKMSASFKK